MMRTLYLSFLLCSITLFCSMHFFKSDLKNEVWLGPSSVTLIDFLMFVICLISLYDTLYIDLSHMIT